MINLTFFFFFVSLLCEASIYSSSHPTLQHNAFIHISDIHYDPYYQPGSPTHCLLGKTGMGCCRKSSIPLDPPGNASKWGEYNCDTPLLLLESTLEWIRTNLTFDFVVYTGDTVNHHDITQTWDSNFDAIKTVTRLLGSLGKPVLNVIGNHDTFIVDQLYTSKPILTDIASLWQNVNLTNGVPIQNFSVGGYYNTSLPFPLTRSKFCVINSLWYDQHNLAWDIDKTKDWGNQFAWMKQHVDGCILLGHIFPTSGEASPEFNTLMEQLTPMWELYGHSHVDQFIIMNSTDRYRLGLIAPSVVPSGHFPGVRRVNYNIGTDEFIYLTDYEQYYLNLTEQQLSDHFIGYKLHYRVVEQYGLKNLSAESFWDLGLRMRTNSTLFDLYCENYAPPNKNCSRDIICDINKQLCQ